MLIIVSTPLRIAASYAVAFAAGALLTYQRLNRTSPIRSNSVEPRHGD